MSFPIVFAADRNYMVPAYVAVSSLLKHLDPNTSVEIYIMVPERDDLFEKIFLELSPAIHFLYVDRTKLRKMTLNPELSHISAATFYRFLIPEMLGEEYQTCLYLDSDLVVTGDISKLLRTPMGDRILLGVRNYFEEEQDPAFVRERSRACGIPDLNTYLNAGVLLINIGELRKLAPAMIADLQQNSYAFNDQDVLNRYCYGRIGLLPPRYNFLTYQLRMPLGEMREREIRKEADRVLIAHYAAPKKPWVYRGSLMADLWEKAFRDCPSEVRKKVLVPYVRQKRRELPVSERMKDLAKYAVRRYVLRSFW